jgi:hypothetical protein
MTNFVMIIFLLIYPYIKSWWFKLNFSLMKKFLQKRLMKTSNLNLIIDHEYIGGFIHFLISRRFMQFKSFCILNMIGKFGLLNNVSFKFQYIISNHDQFLSQDMHKIIWIYLNIMLKFDPIWTILEGSNIG